MNSKQIIKILESGSKEEKIETLESLSNSTDEQIISNIISKLDDPDIEVRGEAFSSLVLNENNITKNLVASLNSESKNIRGFAALVLANRKNYDAISSIIPLTKDERSMVRACALGALGHLKAHQAKTAIKSCFADSNIEVKKSALKATIDIGEKLPKEDIKNFFAEKDPELEKLVNACKSS